MTLGRKQVQPELMDSATAQAVGREELIEQCTNISFGTVSQDIPLTKYKDVL